jgi:hypothetical protein
MGNKASKHNKEEREIIKNNRSKAIENSKLEIDKIKNDLTQQTIENIKNSTNEDGVVALNNMNKMNFLIDKSKEQLSREGLPLTKADLITIVIALEPSYANNIEALNENTITDLNAMIRIIIYNPNRYMNKQETNLQVDNKSSSKRFLKLLKF